MDNINRVVVKQQARTIIKDKFFNLFIVSIIVTLLISVGFNNGVNLSANNNAFELFRKNNSSQSQSGGSSRDSESDPFSDWENPIENFEFNGVVTKPDVKALSIVSEPETARISIGFPYSSLSLVSLIFSPLMIALAGTYLSLVRKRPDEEFALGKEISLLFKNTFDNAYLKKLVGVLLRGLISAILFSLLVVPGAIFYYSSYFTYEIMSDNPNLKPTEALRLSKKMIKGNRTELFVLDLSFIAWFLLCAVTAGIASVYVMPYYFTTKALYYENFRMRALQQGRITTDDFVSFEEKMDAGAQQFGAGNDGTYYNQPNNGSADNYYYYSPQTDNQQPVNADEPVAENGNNDEPLNEPTQGNNFYSEWNNQDNIE